MNGLPRALMDGLLRGALLMAICCWWVLLGPIASCCGWLPPAERQQRAAETRRVAADPSQRMPRRLVAPAEVTPNTARAPAANMTRASPPQASDALPP